MGLERGATGPSYPSHREKSFGAVVGLKMCQVVLSVLCGCNFLCLGKLLYPRATPHAPAHVHAKVTAHQEWVSCMSKVVLTLMYVCTTMIADGFQPQMRMVRGALAHAVWPNG